MSNAQLFQIANTSALLCWIALVVQPKRVAPLARFVVPAAFALLYIWALATAPPTPGGGFGSLGEVMALFTQERAVLAGWVHYLAFDFFVGCWISLDAADRGIAHLAVVPCLVLTFMFGPAGLLLYLVLRTIASRRATATATVG